eukprot:scaffold202893_cov56-Prasinocladus_malaysianus.AAC.1
MPPRLVRPVRGGSALPPRFAHPPVALCVVDEASVGVIYVVMMFADSGIEHGAVVLVSDRLSFHHAKQGHDELA